MTFIFFVLVGFLIPGLTFAQEYVSGVSTEAITMPSLPGTIEGIPTSINEFKNKGQFSFDLDIKVPKGINGHAPDLKLSYNSGAGQGTFGLGWSLNHQSIRVDTRNGVPMYDGRIDFSSDEGDLVRIEKEGSSNTFYAAYINKRQNIYEFNQEDKSWIIHQGDGKKLYFGESNTSRIESGSRIFEWFVEKMVDSVGNEIQFEYSKISGYPYLTKVKYAFKADVPHYSIEFIYEDRDDVLDSFRSGFLVKQTKRCSEIKVKSGSSYIVRSYELLYEDLVSKRSFLKEIRQHGVGGLDLDPPMPPVIYKYSELDLDSEFHTTKIEFSDSESFPPSLNKQRATIIDINRDSFPDVLETSRYGAKVWLNSGENSFVAHYKLPEFISILGEGQSKVLDVDGDRVVDFLATGLYPKYYKGGMAASGGNPGFSSTPFAISNIPRYSIGASNVKTIDINADGRLDILAREVGSFRSFISSSSGNWDRTQEFSINTGAFDLSSPYSFQADMNGDGLTDLVFVRPETLIYLANMGNGSFASPIIMEFSENKPVILSLFKIGTYNFVTDLNSDGYADLVNATASNLAVSFNQGDGSFSETVHLKNIHEGGFDFKGLHISTADINGNGTTDILWTNDFHDWRYLDFSDTPLNLLVEIDNGIGLKTEVNYAVASRFGSNEDALMSIMPSPMLVVSKFRELDNETVVKEEDYRYFGGFYQGQENDFRGFNLIEKIENGDANIDSLYSMLFYEQGRESEKDHQQLMLLEKSDFEYDLSRKSIGHLLKKENYTLTTLATFTGLDEKLPGMPFNSTTIVTEGDFDDGTSDRAHKLIRDITLNDKGFIESDKLITYIDMSQIIRQEEQILAVDNIDDYHITNRVCEKRVYDETNTLLTSERYYYDSQVLCSLTNGLLTKKDVWNGTGYETKNTFTYKSFGSLASYTDSFSHLTSIDYDDFDINPNLVTNALMQTKSATYDDDNGFLSSITDENSLTTSLYYDLYLRQAKIVGPADTILLPTTELVYSFGNSSGTPSSIIVKKREKSGMAGTFDIKEYFDGKSRSIAKISEGPTDKYVAEGARYNKRGEKSLVYQKSFTSSFSIPDMTGVKGFETRYDSFKRPLLIFNPEHSLSVPSYKEFYYPVGETVSYDEERKVSYEYKDALGRKIGHKDAYNKEVEYSFDPLDQLISIVDPEGSTTLFTYDSQKRRSCKLDPTVGVTLYTYNTENLLSQKNMYGYVSGHSTCTAPTSITPRTVDYAYSDALNRMTKIDFPSGSSTEDVTMVYDEVASTYPLGRLTTVDFGTGSKKIDYDMFGNKSKTTLTIGMNNYATEKVYDALGRVERIIYPTVGMNSLSIENEFDAATNLKSVSNYVSSALYADNMAYSPLNQIEAIEFGNNVKTSMTYDDVTQSFRLLNILTEKLGTPNTTLQDIDYDYDLVSNILERNDQKNSFLESYVYDDLHRLISADLNGTSKMWVFNDLGSITSNNGSAYTYDVDRKQIVSTVGGSSYTFDAFGNLSQDATRTYSHDWNNRLRSVTKSATTTTYDYDENGVRTKKVTPSLTTLFIDKYTELRGTDVVRHIYADAKLIASIDESGTISYSHGDHLQSSNLKTDNSGNVIKRIEYLPFGVKRIQTGSYDNIKNRFTGQYEDEESDLYYYQQRYYDPILSRFITADPLYLEEMDKRGTDSQELNLYAYVKNNPIKYVDPSGNESYLVSRDAVVERSPYSHNYIAVVQVPLKPEIYSFGPAKDGTLQNISGEQSIGTHATDVADWESGNSVIEGIGATDDGVRAAVDKVSNILDAARIDYRYPFDLGPTYNSNSAAQAVANTAQGSDVKEPSSSTLGPVGSENSSNISGPTHESD